MLTRDNVFEEERGERFVYLSPRLEFNDDVLLPLTKDGFEALLERATSEYKLPIDNAMRQVLAGYVHHIPNEQNTTTIGTIAKMLYKSVANSTTWRIDQEIKLKLRDDAEKKLRESSTNVTDLPQKKTE